MFTARQSISQLKEKFFETPLGTVIDTVRNPYDMLQRRQRRYGDLFALRFLGLPNFYVCSDPDTVKQVVMGSYDQFERFTGGIELILGPRALINMQDELHKSRRKLMMPPFHVESVRAHGPAMLQMTDRVLSKLRFGQRLRLIDTMRDITLRMIIRCIFGVEEGPRFEELHRVTIEYLEMAFQPDFVALGAIVGRQKVQRMILRAAQAARRVSADAPFTPSSLPFKKVADRLGRIYGILDAELDRCLAEGPKTRTDVAAMLLQLRFEDGQPMTRDELCEQLILLMLGGYETTANTLCWAVYALLRNPDKLARVRSEVETVMGSGFDPARVRDLHYLGAALQESMRLYPVAIGVSRRLKRPLRVLGQELPAGQAVIASLYLAQRNPALWKDPEAFLPERMLERKPPPHMWFPFGAGVWRCLGAAFADHEMRIVLARLVTQISLELIGDIRPMQLGITAVPSRGLPVVVTGVKALE